ncbi:MAG: DNA primase, partial [Bowdeniella nasicola]|nr:DNA primase [Bowdeniella nasicola]
RGGEVIFTFDGDAAGRKAALKAFHEDQSFGTQTFVAVEPRGMDPCDLRLAEGDEAVRRLIDAKMPLFEFVIRSTLAELDLTTAEGRVAGLRSCAPIIATIRDRALRAEYIRALAGWVGMDHATVSRAVARPRERAVPQVPRPERGGRRHQIARQALQLALQYPNQSYHNGFDSFDVDAFQSPQLTEVAGAIIDVGGTGAVARYGGESHWRDAVLDRLDQAGQSVAGALIVAALPVAETDLTHYLIDVFNELVCIGLDHQIHQLRTRLQQLDDRSPEFQEVFSALIARETERRQRRG